MTTQPAKSGPERKTPRTASKDTGEGGRARRARSDERPQDFLLEALAAGVPRRALTDRIPLAQDTAGVLHLDQACRLNSHVVDSSLEAALVAQICGNCGRDPSRPLVHTRELLELMVTASRLHAGGHDFPPDEAMSRIATTRQLWCELSIRMPETASWGIWTAWETPRPLLADYAEQIRRQVGADSRLMRPGTAPVAGGGRHHAGARALVLRTARVAGSLDDEFARLPHQLMAPFTFEVLNCTALTIVDHNTSVLLRSTRLVGVDDVVDLGPASFDESPDVLALALRLAGDDPPLHAFGRLLAAARLVLM